jgi:hypothetical protein
MRKPIIFPPENIYAEGLGGVNIYLPFYDGPIAQILTLFHFEFAYVCRFNQWIFFEVARQDARADAAVKHLASLSDSEDQSEEACEMTAIGRSRILEGVRNIDLDIDGVSNLADQLTIVGLWAFAEKYLNRIYSQTVQKKLNSSILLFKNEYRWDEFSKKYFDDLGVPLDKSDLYNDANECRLVNNAIKHGGIISRKLASFPMFHGREGLGLETFTLETQRYCNAIYSFIGSTADRCHKAYFS